MARSPINPRELPRPVERATLFLTEAGHPLPMATAMAVTAFGDASVLPGQVRHAIRAHAHLTMTPQEREDFACQLQARRVIAEGVLLSLRSDAVRAGAVLSAHALCECLSARRPISLQIGGAQAELAQVQAARERLVAEVAELDALVEAAISTNDDADDETPPLSRETTNAGKPNPRVVHLQNRLNSLGHRVQADGIFGPMTEEAVKDFQTRVGLDPADGAVDTSTSDALRRGGKVMVAGVEVDANPAVAGGPTAAPLTPPSADRAAVNNETGNSASQSAPAEKGSQPKEKDEPAKKNGKTISLKVNLGESVVVCECGARLVSEGVCQRGHRVEEGILTAAQDRERSIAGKASHEFKKGDRVQIKPFYRPGTIQDVPPPPRSQLDPNVMERMALVLGDGDQAPTVRSFKDLEPLHESAQTPELSTVHAPIGKGGTNWVTKSKPGNTGQLPAYIQNIRNAIMRDGKDESSATAIAVDRCKDWAAGGGGVSKVVQAAAAKAIAEFEAMRGASDGKSAAKDAK